VSKDFSSLVGWSRVSASNLGLSDCNVDHPVSHLGQQIPMQIILATFRASAIYGFLAQLWLQQHRFAEFSLVLFLLLLLVLLLLPFRRLT
jgi:hypothetical protein